MATINVKFRPSAVEGREGSIYYQVIHNRRPRQILTTYKIHPDEWDAKRNNVSVNNDSKRQPIVRAIKINIRLDLQRFVKIISRLDSNGVAYSADDICEAYRTYIDTLSFHNFVENKITGLKRNGKLTTAAHYRSMLNSVKRFLSSSYPEKTDVLLDVIDAQWVIDYEAWLLSTGVVRNTSSFYIRILRSVYNSAVDCEIIEQRYPFRRVYTGIDKTIKRALSVDALIKIKRLDLSGDGHMDFARDMFLLAFYFRGMSFIDMSFLRKSDLKDGSITYRRKKTGQRLVIKWTPEMQAILDKYTENESPYLLPIIKRDGPNERHAYRNAAEKVNRSLKKIAELAGLHITLTHYVARHSWASVARSKNIPLSVISEGMGHDSEATTRIYLASLDTASIDKANDEIISSL